MDQETIEQIKEKIEDVEILSEDWEKPFKVLQDKSVSDNVSYLRLVNYCFDNMMKINTYYSDENLNKYLLTIKINKIRNILIEYEQGVQPSKHYVLLRINEYVQNNRQNLDSLITYFSQIFLRTGSGKI